MDRRVDRAPALPAQPFSRNSARVIPVGGVGGSGAAPPDLQSLAGLALVLAAREGAVHLRQHVLGRDHDRGPDARGPLVPEIRRDVERLALLRGGAVFVDVEILDDLVVAGPHLQDLPVEELVAVGLPDFDDLLGVRASRPLPISPTSSRRTGCWM